MIKPTSLIGAIVMTTAFLSKVSAQDIAVVNPASLFDPVPFGFSHAVVAQDASHLAFLAGQGGQTRDGALSPDFAAQVEQAYRNLKSALDAVGARPEQVTKITTYVVDYDPSKLEIMGRRLTEVFGEHLPAQTLVPVPRLALDGMLFEVDAVAVLSNAD